MTNTETLNTSNKNTNNCGKLKYILSTTKIYRDRERDRVIDGERDSEIQ